MARGKRRRQQATGASSAAVALCVCGSGRPYRRCHGTGGDTLVEPTVTRLLNWVDEELSADIEAARVEFVAASARKMDALGDDAEMLGLEWAVHDWTLADGRTPAETFAAEAELSPAERERALWLVDAKLSLYRVLAVKDDEWLQLEEIGSGRQLHAVSPRGPEGVVRGDLLAARVLPADPPELWGRALAYPADLEPALLAAAGEEDHSARALALLAFQSV